jgi:PKD repeat protein
LGDGTGGAGDRPTHAYAQPGEYTAMLTVEGDQVGQCSSTATDEVRVTVIASPLAHIAAPEAVPVGTAVSLSAEGSAFPGGTIEGYAWDFGDGGAATGGTVEHVFEEAGVYRVVLSLESDASVEDCRIVEADHFITVNAAPLAEAGDDRFAVVDEELLFDASGSVDRDSGIVDYHWDFGDGDSARGLQVRHAYRQAGDYDLALTVTDAAGIANSSATDIARIAVAAPPGPAIAGPAAACIGDLVALSTPRSDDVGFTWLLGDGETAEGDAVEYAYDRPGRYTVTLFADDTSQRTRGIRYTTRVLHVNQPPHAGAGADRRACPGETLSFDASASRDRDGAVTRWRWYFGDGATAEGETAEHAFAEPGTYEVRLTVEDDSGSTCNVTSDTLQVAVNAPPVADAGPDRSAWVGGANDVLELDGSGSSDPDGSALSYLWELGDGTVLFGERLRHTLFQGGELPVTLTVSDTSGLACGSATDTAVIDVQERR